MGAVAPSPSSGAVPKRPACASGHGCAATAGVHSNLPHLQDLRADARAVAQANSMVDSLETVIQGNGVQALQRGWSRPGGNNAPRVAIPWPQDFIIGHGKKSCPCYDDLVFEWTQGCLAMVEREEDMSVARGMLALLRATLRDTAYHRFEVARYSYGCILSMMEDGILHWNDTTCIAEEHRSALIARGSQVPTRDSVPNVACPSRCYPFLPPKEVRVLTKVRTIQTFPTVRAAQCHGRAYIGTTGVSPKSRSPKRRDLVETCVSQMPGPSAH
jgi:hypothetical protein